MATLLSRPANGTELIGGLIHIDKIVDLNYTSGTTFFD